MPFYVVIPARFAATRLPGKPLADIAGKPMLQHVYERACQSQATRVIIATEDQRVQEAALGFGAEVCMTSPDHLSGTERLHEVINLLQLSDDSVIVNVQGDEPFVSALNINQVAANIVNYPSAAITTLCELIEDNNAIVEPSIVKVTRDAQGYALYFSRSPIPWSKPDTALTISYYRHLGLYAYRAKLIRQYVTWPICPLEQTESLEQLRALRHGERIHVDIAVDKASLAVDTPADLERARLYCQQFLA
jgi:3-deoxy-manno-octulosonate cytidylyltransferase (CMP-KDO synthetase)